MKYQVSGPNGQQYVIEGPDGASDDQVLDILQNHLRDNPPPPPDDGLWSAFKAGAARSQGEMAGLGAALGLRDKAGADQEKQEREAYAARTYQPSKWGERPIHRVAEEIAGGAPTLISALGAGAAGTALAGPVGGAIGAGAVMFPGQVASNVAAQEREGQEPNVATAAGTAIPQTLLNMAVYRMAPGVKGLFGAMGKELTDAEAKKIAAQSFTQAALDWSKHGAVVAGEQGLVNVTNTALERLQAGASTSDPQARDAYLESLLSGAGMGAVLGAAGRGYERHVANGVAGAAKAKEQADLADQQMLQRKQEADALAAKKASPEYGDEVSKNWDAAKQRLGELTDTLKGLDKNDEFYKENLAEAVKAKNEYQNGDWIKARQAFREAQPGIMRRQREQQGTLLDAAPIEGEGMQLPQGGKFQTEPADAVRPGKPAEEPPPPPPTNVEQYVQDALQAGAGPSGLGGNSRTLGALMRDPAMAQKALDAGLTIPGMSRKQNNSFNAALKLQLEKRAQDMKAQALTRDDAFVEDANQQGENLQEHPEGFQAPQDEPFIDPNAVPELPKPPAPTIEQAVTGEGYPQPPWLDALMGRTFGADGQKPALAPVANAAQVRAQIDGLYNEAAAAQRDHERAVRSGNRDSAAAASQRADHARQQLDQLRGQSPYAQPSGNPLDGTTGSVTRHATPEQGSAQVPYRAEVVKARDEKDAALNSFMGAVNDIRDGVHDEAVEGGHTDPEAISRQELEHNAEQARQDYIAAAIREAQLHHQAENKPFDRQRANLYAQRVSAMLDRYKDRQLKKLDEQHDLTTPEEEQAQATEPAKPDAEQLLLTENPKSKLLPEEAANLQHQLANLRETRFGIIEPKLQEAKGTEAEPHIRAVADGIDAEIKQVTDRLMEHIQGNAESKPPRTVPPPRRASQTLPERLSALHSDFITPVSQARRVETGFLKPQFGNAEAVRHETETGQNATTFSGMMRRRMEHASNEIDHALQRKDLPQDVRSALEQAQEAIKAGHVSRDLLDEVAELAHRARTGLGMHASDVGASRTRSEGPSWQAGTAKAGDRPHGPANQVRTPGEHKQLSDLHRLMRDIASETQKAIARRPSGYPQHAKGAEKVPTHDRSIKSYRTEERHASPDLAQKEIPGMDKAGAPEQKTTQFGMHDTVVDHGGAPAVGGSTVLSRATPEEFANHPQLKAARKAVDTARQQMAESAERLKGMGKWLSDKLADHSGAALKHKENFLVMREAVATAWKQGLRDWHFGDQIKPLTKQLHETNALLQRTRERVKLYTKQEGGAPESLLKRIDDLKGETEVMNARLDDLHAQAADMLAKFDLHAKALMDDGVAAAKAKYDEAEARHQRTRTEVGTAPRTSLDLIKARLALEEARKQSDAMAKEAKARKDEWQAKIVRGLELPGSRHTTEKTGVLTVKDEKGDWGTEDILARKSERIHAEPGGDADSAKHAEIAQLREQLRKASKPMERNMLQRRIDVLEASIGETRANEAGHYAQEGAKVGARERADRETSQRVEEAERGQSPFKHPFKRQGNANEVAARIKGEPGTALRADETSKLMAEKRTEREQLMQGFSAKDPAERAEIAKKVRALDAELADADKKLRQEQRAATKQTRQRKKQRAETNATLRARDRHSRAVDDLEFGGEQDTGPFDAPPVERPRGGPSDPIRKGETPTPEQVAWRAAQSKELERARALRERARANAASMEVVPANKTPKPSEGTPSKSIIFDVHGKTFAEAARIGAESARGASKVLFQILADHFDQQPKGKEGRVLAASMQGAHYDPKVHEVHMNYTGYLGERARTVHTLLHELTHAATSIGLYDNPLLRKRVEALRDHVIAWTKTPEGRAYVRKKSMGLRTVKAELAHNGIYGLANAHEFMAETFGNSAFRSLLEQVPAMGMKKSVFHRIVDAVAQFLKLDPKLRTALSDAFSITEEAMHHQLDTLDSGREIGNTKVHNKPDRVTSDIMAVEPTFQERFLDHFGLRFAQATVDKHRALETVERRALEEGKITPDQWHQGTYNLRMADNASNYVSQIASEGPMKVVVDDLGNGRKQARYESTKGANMIAVAEHVGRAMEHLGWDRVQGEKAITAEMVGDRANATENGWARLNSDPKKQAKARQEYEHVKAALDANSKARAAMDAAKAEAKGVFDGTMDFAAATGRVSKEEAARLKAMPYIPWMRVKDGDVSMFDSHEKPISIGNIKDQDDLMQMMGGDQKILPGYTGMMVNAYLLTRMGLHNMAVKETGYLLNHIGMATKMGEGRGPSGQSNNVLHWKEDGKDKFATVDTDMFGVPAHMIVKGMEGIKMSFPVVLQAMGIPANWLRKFVTRNPAYAVRQLLRDPANAYILGAVDGNSFLSALKHMKDMQYGASEAEQALIRGGAVSSNVMTHDVHDLDNYLRQIAEGKQSGWRGLLQKADQLAMRADTATRATIYEDAKKKGFSEGEAQLRAFESMNFSRKGLSPSMHMLSTMIPFFNAQVQGLDVLYRSMRGHMPYAQRLDLQRKLVVRGAMLAGVATTYALSMQNDPDYRKMKPQERYQNFVVRIPGMKDLVKIPIPYEAGIIFKAIPEAILDAARTDTKVSAAVLGLGAVTMTSAPNATPAAIWPLIQASMNRTSFGPIETDREKQFTPAERWRESTPEALKALGKKTGNIHIGDTQLGISPIMLEHLVRGYTGSLGVGLLHVMDPVMADATQHPSQSAADKPLVGALFQRGDGRYLIDRAYDRMTHILEVKATYEQMMKEGRKAEATQYAQDQSNLLAAKDMAETFKANINKATKDERAIRMDPKMTTAQKDAKVKAIREYQNRESQKFYGASERTRPQARPQ